MLPTFPHIFVLSSPRGGFTSIHHIEIRDITANLLTEVCNDVCVEPDLQEVTTEELSGQSAIMTVRGQIGYRCQRFLGWEIRADLPGRQGVQSVCTIQ